MSIKIIKYYIVLLIIFFSWVSLANADVIINEVQLSPTGERFVELYNQDSSQSLTGWSIKRKTASGTEYPLVSASRLEGKSIQADGYFLLVNENDYVGSVTPDATWAKSYNLASDNTIYLYNQNGIVVSKVGWGEASDCEGTCIPNPTSGQSIQRISSTSWGSASPTPGEENVLSSEEETNNENLTDTTDDTEDTTSSNSNSKKDIPEFLKITTQIIIPKIITAQIPFSISSLTTTNRGETHAVGRFVWNFGDGMVSEVRESSPFTYSYEYPGEYALTLSYFDSTFSKVADATDKIIVKVVPSEIYISGVGNYVDPYVEIGNKSNYEIILSNWIVKGGARYFVIPVGTTILPNKKIKLSPKITGFTGGDIKSVVITDPNKEITATYPIVTSKSIQKNLQVNKNINNTILPENNLQKNSQVINLNDLGASAQNGGIDISNSVYPFVGLLLVIGLGVTSFLLIKKKDNNADYIEREIRAEDMTIIE